MLEHENHCPEIPVTCASCSTTILRKNEEVSFVVHMYNHAVQMHEEILGTIAALPLVSLFVMFACNFSSLFHFLLFFLCLFACFDKKDCFEYNTHLSKYCQNHAVKDNYDYNCK